jgi:hypothetical protein
VIEVCSGFSVDSMSAKSPPSIVSCTSRRSAGPLPVVRRAAPPSFIDTLRCTLPVPA